MGEAAARIEQQSYAVRLVVPSAKLDRTVNVLADTANEAIREALAGLDGESGFFTDRIPWPGHPPVEPKLPLGRIHPLPPWHGYWEQWEAWSREYGAWAERDAAYCAQPARHRPEDLRVSVGPAVADDHSELRDVSLPVAPPSNDNATTVRETIWGPEEAALTRFFGNGRAERSPSGTILEIALLYSYHEPIDPLDYGDNPPAGIELLERLDARPTAESRESSRDGPDVDKLIEQGVVSRRLAVVRQFDPLSHTVLSAFYGDAGAVHALQEYGREGCLVPYTKAGQRLARIGARKSRGSKRRASAVEHVQNEMSVALIRARSGLAQAGAGEESSLIARGLSEARDLLARAARAWNSTAPERRKAGG